MNPPKKESNTTLVGALIGAVAVIVGALITATARIYAANNKTSASASVTQQTPPGIASPIINREPPIPVTPTRIVLPPYQPPTLPSEPPATKSNPKDGADMILIPAGEFLMGSNDGYDFEKPQHSVYLDNYYI